MTSFNILNSFIRVIFNSFPMRLITIVLSVFLFSSMLCTAQENITDSLGCRQGYWKEFKDIDGSKVLLSEGSYVNGRKSGVWIAYYKSGKIKSSIEFKDGKASGPYVTYFENGNISEKGSWGNNRQQGDLISYYNSGIVKQKSTFNADGKMDGEYLRYTEAGSVKGEGVYSNGKVKGIYKWYYDSGEILELNYADSLKIKFYKNGKISDWGSSNLKMTFYESGLKQAITHFKNGKVHGESLYYYDHEILSCKMQYENGERNGPFSFYHENGNVKYQGAYKNNKMSGERICYDKDGNLANGEFIFYQFGLKYIANYISGRPEGKLKVFDSNGSLNMSIEFKNGLPHGSHVYYHNNATSYTKPDNYENGEYVK